MISLVLHNKLVGEVCTEEREKREGRGRKKTGREDEHTEIWIAGTSQCTDWSCCWILMRL